MDSEQEGSEDNEDEWNPEARATKGPPRKLKKEKAMTSSPHRSGRGPGRPPKHQHHHKESQLQHSNAHTNADTNTGSDFHSIKVHSSVEGWGGSEVQPLGSVRVTGVTDLI